MPADIQQALRSLTNPLAPRTKLRPARHDPTDVAEIREDEAGFTAYIAPLDFDPPSPPVYHLTHRPHALEPIRWGDLVGIANRFDDLDRAAGRQQPGERNWYQRLYTTEGEQTAVLFGATPEGLKPVDHLELRGIKHLIGLPGAGKTTLLYLVPVIRTVLPVVFIRYLVIITDAMIPRTDLRASGRPLHRRPPPRDRTRTHRAGQRARRWLSLYAHADS